MGSTGKDVILVTGSSGLIGSATIRRLANGRLLVGFDREGPPHPPRAAECVHVDLTSDESVREGVERVRFAYGNRIASVIHLAAYYDFSGEPSPLYEQLTVGGTERLLRALEGFEVEQFVFSSSMLVHAPCNPGERITEQSPLLPKWDYPQSKVDTEHLLHEQHGDVPLLVLRIAGVYDDRCHSIPIAHQVQRIFERRLISHVFPGVTSHGQAFVHLDDLTEALALAVERRRALPSELTLLIGEPETFSYDLVQRELGRLIHNEVWETKQVPKAMAKAGAWLQDRVPGEEPFIKPWMIDLADDHFELDISRARAILGWQPRRSLFETLPSIVAGLMADPLGWYETNKLEPPSWFEETRKARERGAERPTPLWAKERMQR
jgi:nucleoside-diphosphate-sugar epimerase